MVHQEVKERQKLKERTLFIIEYLIRSHLIILEEGQDSREKSGVILNMVCSKKCAHESLIVKAKNFEEV